MNQIKKLLILGGAFQHEKLVVEAQKMGIYTIVTDNLPVDKSPCKQIADEHWMINIYDVDEIVKKCANENIDGVISAWLDPCQRPYAEICERLGVHAYCNPEQVIKMTDKLVFKEMCKTYGVDVITDYSFDDVVTAESLKKEFTGFTYDSASAESVKITRDKNEITWGNFHIILLNISVWK
jgi:phosphoribosylaminoimidazole carboxylase (NCAIR synthetase)